MAEDYMFEPEEKEEKRNRISDISMQSYSLPSLPGFEIEVKTNLPELTDIGMKKLFVLSVEAILLLYSLLAFAGLAPLF